MLSISRSRYSLPAQFLFLAVNGVGVFLVTIYNASTPDLYPNNAHHKLGWVLTWVMVAQVVMGIVSAYGIRKGGDDRGAFVPVSAANMQQHQRMHDLQAQADMYRFSNDSGQGTEPNTESLRSQSISSNTSDDIPLPELRDHEDEEEEKAGLMHGSRVDRFLSKKIPGLLSFKVLRVFGFFYIVIDRVILLLGFVALTSGIVTYGGFFVRVSIPSRKL